MLPQEADVITQTEECEQAVRQELEAISRQIQQGVWDCTSNPLVPKAFQFPVDSGSLVAAIESITRMARAPLEEKLEAQQEQISRLQETIQLLRAER